MTFSDFLGVFSRNHFLEGGFTIQWGASFLGGGHPFEGRGIDFDGGFSKKVMRW